MYEDLKNIEKKLEFYEDKLKLFNKKNKLNQILENIE